MGITRNLHPTMIAALAAAGPAAQQFFTAQKEETQYTVQKLPSSNEVEEKFYHRVSIENGYPNARLADPETTKEALSILGELRSRIPTVLPGVTRIAAETKVFIIDEKQSNAEAITIESDNKQSAIFGLVITRGALEQEREREQKKDTIAHELAHHVFDMNPELKKDSRFQPKTPEFLAEQAAIDVRVKAGEEKYLSDWRDTLKEFPSLTSEEKSTILAREKSNYEKGAAINKEKRFSEAQTDKLGVWLSHNIDTKTLSQMSVTKEEDAAGIKKYTCFDPDHPAPATRLAEINASARDIIDFDNKTQNPPLRGSPTKPMDTPKVHIPNNPPALPGH